MAKLELAILKTLAYTGLFDQALSEDELAQFLIGYRLKRHENLPKTVPGTKRAGDILALTSQKHLLKLKDQQADIQQQKLSEVDRWLWVYKLIPWIRLVAVTGSVAGGSPREKDDIDILIVTDNHRMWLSRVLLILSLSLLRKRRRPGDHPAKVSNKFCLNMWRSASKLKEEHRDLYTAVELARMVPVLNRHQAYQQYVKANSWILEFLPNLDLEGRFNDIKDDGFTAGQSKTNGHIKRAREVWRRALNTTDNAAKHLQLHLMRSRTNETVTTTYLKFHPYDYRTEILTRYQQQLEKLKLKE